MYKFIAAIRKDLNLPKGKMAAQVAHAAVEAVAKSDNKLVEQWRKEGGKKVVVEVDDLKTLKALEADAKKQKLTTAIIKDAGRTIVAPGTITCVGVGPDTEERMDPVTGKLRIV